MSQDLPRGFKGIWIPKDIWLHTELSCTEKCLWAEIDSLDREVEGCTASNEYLCKLFDMSERTLQEKLSRLRKLGLIHYEKTDGRIRIMRSDIKTIFRTPEVRKDDYQNNISHPTGAETRTPAHKDIYVERKEENIVCCEPPVEAAPFASILKKIRKKHPDGHEVEISLDDIFREAVRSSRKWTTDEIKDAWDVLCEYSGPIRDPFRFIEGTVENIKKKKLSQKLSKKPLNKGSDECLQNEISKKPKINTAVDDSSEHLSLGSILAKKQMMSSNGSKKDLTS